MHVCMRLLYSIHMHVHVLYMPGANIFVHVINMACLCMLNGTPMHEYPKVLFHVCALLSMYSKCEIFLH